jgi:PAS domain-containing protein
LVTPDAASQALWASATEAILAVGEEGLIESVNPAAERLFGYGAVELVGRDLGVLLPEPDLGRYQRHVRPLWASADAPSIRARFIEIGNARRIDDVLEMAGRRKDGAPIPLAISLIKIQFGGRRLFNLVIRDNSQRQRERFAIRTSRDDMLAILDQMRVGSVLVDADERILFVNAACKEWMNVNPAAALGCPVADWFFFDATSRYALERALALPAAARATAPPGRSPGSNNGPGRSTNRSLPDRHSGRS